LNFVAFSLLAKKHVKICQNQAESVSLSVLIALIFSNRESGCFRLETIKQHSLSSFKSSHWRLHDKNEDN
jgi:hypothetical protein